MKQIQIDYALRYATIQRDRECFDIPNCGLSSLKGLATSKVYLLFETPREHLILESGLLDFIYQWSGVVQELDKGAQETFAIDGDYYSNHFGFLMDSLKNVVEITEPNGGTHVTTQDYGLFRRAVLRFVESAIVELQLLYPELNSNNVFVSKFIPLLTYQSRTREETPKWDRPTNLGVNNHLKLGHLTNVAVLVGFDECGVELRTDVKDADGYTGCELISHRSGEFRRLNGIRTVTGQVFDENGKIYHVFVVEFDEDGDYESSEETNIDR
jgi:hypothetical protein